MRHTRALGASVLALTAAPALAQLTLLAPGPQLGTHTGNLVTNGSFEQPFGGPGTAQPFWATGATGTPFAVPTGWISSGSPSNYAVWGRDAGSPFRIRNSGVIPDGGNALYFGNGQGAATSLAPTFNANGEVTFSGTPTINTAAGFPTPVILTQTVPTNLTPAPSYILSFWVSGEGAGFPSTTTDGIFGLRVTNTAAGDPLRYFAVPSGNPLTYGSSKRFEFSVVPLNPSLPVTLEFINWGHFNLFPYGMGATTELALDDVIVNPVPAPSAVALLALGVLAARRRR